MSAIAKLRDQIAIARETRTFVVLTADEAQAIVDEIGRIGMSDRPMKKTEGPGDAVPNVGSGHIDSAAKIAHFHAPRIASAPPYEGDDEHA